jgi:hypothetical protein
MHGQGEKSIFSMGWIEALEKRRQKQKPGPDKEPFASNGV